jgi:diguanylate cyclase (GGDEF)-like protein
MRWARDESGRGALGLITGLLGGLALMCFLNGERVLDDARAGRRSPVVLFVVDLDGFSAVNDRHGYLVGDAVLAELAVRLRALLPDAGLASRLGGDEFAVLLSGLGPDSAVDVAERVLARLRDPVELPDDAGQVRVGVSIGLAVASATTDVGTLMGLADVAMYAARISGAGGIEVFSADDHRVGTTRSFPVTR